MSRVWTRLTAVCLLVVAVSGCANLSAIREFASLSAGTAGYTTTTKEYIESPVQLERYTLETDTNRITDLRASATARKAQEAKLLALQTSVAQYMTALAQLSADELISYSAEFNAFTKQATDAKLFSESEAKSVSALAGLISKAITDGYRQRKLRDVIREANGPLQDVITALRETTKLYAGAQANDALYVRQYYSNLMDETRMSCQAHDALMRLYDPIRSQSAPVTRAEIDKLLADARSACQTPLLQQLRGESRDAIAGIEQKQKKAAQFDESLDRIGKAHGLLYENLDKLPSDEIRRQIGYYSQELKVAYKATRSED